MKNVVLCLGIFDLEAEDLPGNYIFLLRYMPYHHYNKKSSYPLRYLSRLNEREDMLDLEKK